MNFTIGKAKFLWLFEDVHFAYKNGSKLLNLV